jgi:Ulp1 family protease
LFFAVNQGNIHWHIVVVDTRNKTVYGIDPYHHVCPYAEHIFDFLCKLSRDINKQAKSWKVVQQPPPEMGIPKQTGGDDCGVIICMVANLLSSTNRQPKDFGMHNIAECRRHIAAVVKAFMSREL